MKQSPRPRTTWVLVADRSRARFLAAGSLPTGTLEQIVEFVHPEGRLMGHDVDTDRAGHFRAEAGGFQTGDPETDFKHHSARQFAARIIEYLEKARCEQQFVRLAVIAFDIENGCRSVRYLLRSPCHLCNPFLFTFRSTGGTPAPARGQFAARATGRSAQ